MIQFRELSDYVRAKAQKRKEIRANPCNPWLKKLMYAKADFIGIYPGFKSDCNIPNIKMVQRQCTYTFFVERWK